MVHISIKTYTRNNASYCNRCTKVINKDDSVLFIRMRTGMSVRVCSECINEIKEELHAN